MTRTKSAAVSMLLGFFIVATSASAARAGDLRWISASVGSGENIDVLRVEGLWQPGCECAWLARIGATPMLSAHVEYWNARGDRHPNDNTWSAGVLAGAHWLLSERSRWKPYVEFGIGAIGVTDTQIGTRDLTSPILFDERLATGFALDPAGKYQLAAYAEHRSNGKIKQPNDGLTTYGLELRVALP
jgi:hypothetical protein